VVLALAAGLCASDAEASEPSSTCKHTCQALERLLQRGPGRVVSTNRCVNGIHNLGLCPGWASKLPGNKLCSQWPELHRVARAPLHQWGG